MIMMEPRHKKWRIGVIVCAALVLVVTAAINFNYVFTGAQERNMRALMKDYIISGGYLADMMDGGVDMGCLSDLYMDQWMKMQSPTFMDPDEILAGIPWGTQGPYISMWSPPSWLTATMMVVNLLLSLTWIVYGHTLLCRRTKPGASTYLYYEPEFIPWLTYVLFSIAQVIGTAEIYLDGSLLLWVSTIFTLVRLILTIAALWLALRALEKSAGALKMAGRASEIGWTIGLVHNGIAFYGTWVLILFHINLTGTLIYFLNVDQDVASYIVYSIAGVFIVLMVWLDNVHAYEKFKYVYGGWLCFIISFIGLLVNNWDEDCGVAILMMCIFLLAVIGFFIKLVVCCCRNSEKREMKEQLGVSGQDQGLKNMPQAITKQQPGDDVQNQAMSAEPPASTQQFPTFVVPPRPVQAQATAPVFPQFNQAQALAPVAPQPLIFAPAPQPNQIIYQSHPAMGTMQMAPPVQHPFMVDPVQPQSTRIVYSIVQ